MLCHTENITAAMADAGSKKEIASVEARAESCIPTSKVIAFCCGVFIFISFEKPYPSKYPSRLCKMITGTKIKVETAKTVLELADKTAKIITSMATCDRNGMMSITFCTCSLKTMWTRTPSTMGMTTI